MARQGWAKWAFCAALWALGVSGVEAAPSAQTAPDAFDRMLPLPKSFESAGRNIALPRQLTLSTATTAAEEHRAARVVAAMLVRSGLPAKVTDKGTRPAFLRFRMVTGLPPEGYRLTITATGALVEASDHSGLLYGGVSFWQLATAGDRMLPLGTFADHPQYRWRGLMLDSARHFQPPQFVLRFIDWMAAHKLNRFHWHLVDDQGWRIEIKKYPRLVAASAWRVPASAPGAPSLPRIGGYYTQAQIRQIVSYAADRGIEIVPEIEMPGHALSAIRAYPEMGLGVPAPAGVEAHWGVFPWLYNTEDKTFGFLTDILDEVMALFPSRYIHVGGDEAVKDQWKASAETQARMKSLGIADEHALQSWFMSRIGTHLAKRGRTLVGWDEILEGGIPANATITSWRGAAGGITAAKSGHDAILSPAPDLYFDHIQSASPHEPPGRGGVISLSSVLAFDPLPPELSQTERKHILGLQGNIWTEHIRTEERLAWMAYPRGSAIAELGWNGASQQGALAFAPRLVRQLDRLRPFGLQAADSAFRPQAKLTPSESGVQVALSTEIGAPIRYTLDGSVPVLSSAEYRGPLTVTAPATLRARAFLGDRALPGELLQRLVTSSSALRDSRQLKTCAGKVNLALEDDYPASGERAVFHIDVLSPCWIYEQAALRPSMRVVLEVGQVPFNFQVGKDRDTVTFRQPKTPEGEFELRAPGCDGALIAQLPLAAATGNPGVTRLEADLALPATLAAGAHDVCITYTAQSVDPLWAVKAINLVQRP